MTLAAVWKVGERICAITDTRISHLPGNILTDHGPKLLPITMLCRQPSPLGGEPNRLAYSASFGFAYAGSTLSALSTHALSNTLCQNLYGPPGAAPADLHEIATAIADIGARYMTEIGQLGGATALFSAIVFGFCIRTGRFRAFKLAPELAEAQPLRVILNEHDLYTPESLLVIGSRPDLLEDRVRRERPNFYVDHNGPVTPDMQEAREINLPRRALAGIVAEAVDDRIGGATQEAWVTHTGFIPISRMVPIPPLPSGRNVTSMTLGFDLNGFDRISGYSFTLPIGMF
jgi:hypothetical protein